MVNLICSSASYTLVGLFVGLLALQASTVSCYDYKDALDKSLLFFEAQRSGKIPSDQRVKWRVNSGLKDGSQQGVDLVGGYYDAGDHVKFGLPMAFTVTMLSWAATDFKSEILGVNQMGHTLAAIKWGTDYFIKAHKKPYELWGQVGDGESDHYCWERAEYMTTSRTAYKIDTKHPGSDLAGETAAALAAASLAFKPYNSTYSQLLLVHAKQLFTFADKFRGLYDDSITNANNFYTSSGYHDELLWAATWLYRATYDNYYLKYVVDNGASFGGTGWAVKEFSWDNKYAGVQILLSKILLENGGGYYTSTLSQYKAKADYFVCASLQKNAGYNVPMTPGGLFYVREWNNMQYVSSSAFLLAVYSDYLSKAKADITCPDCKVYPNDLLIASKAQADYILGKNPKYLSYLIGYGPSYPIHVHHRDSSIASTGLKGGRVGCVQGFESYYRLPQANPNVLYGGLVGGPNRFDQFSDDRSNYEQSEATLTGSAPLVGLFCKLYSVYGNSGSYKPVVPVSPKSPYQQPQTGYSYKPVVPVLPKSPYQQPQSVYLKKQPYAQPISATPVQFLHSITDTWTIGKATYYRHKVVIKNASQKPITYLKLGFENLTGQLWGLSTTQEKYSYVLPQWITVLQPGSECIFVYIQGGSQAKISVQSYH